MRDHSIRSSQLKWPHGSYTGSDDVVTGGASRGGSSGRAHPPGLGHHGDLVEYTVHRSYYITLPDRVSTGTDPLSHDSGAPQEREHYAIVVLSTLFGATPDFVEDYGTGAGNRIRAVWCCPSATSSTPGHELYVSGWGAPAFCLENVLVGGQPCSTWIVHEYITSENMEFEVSLRRHPVGRALCELSTPQLACLQHAALLRSVVAEQQVAELGAGSFAGMILGCGENLHDLRWNLLDSIVKIVGPFAEDDAGSDAQRTRILDMLADYHSSPRTSGFSVREAPSRISGRNGSWTGSDDVKGKGEAKATEEERTKMRRAAKAKEAGRIIGGAVGKVGAQLMGVPHLSRDAENILAAIGGKAATAINKHILGNGPYSSESSNMHMRLPSGCDVLSNSGDVRANVLSGLHGPGSTSSKVIGDLRNMELSGMDARCDVWASSDIVSTVTSHPLSAGSVVVISIPYSPANVFFPRSRQVAAQYDQYRPLGLAFQFRSTYGPLSSGALGPIAMAFVKDLNTPPPISVSACLRLPGAVQGVIDGDLTHFPECAEWARNFYTCQDDIDNASYSAPSGGDQANCGIFYLVVEAAAPVGANTVLGLLHCFSANCYSGRRTTEGVFGRAHFARNNYTAALPFGTSAGEVIGTGGFVSGGLSFVTITGTTLSLYGVPFGTLLRISIRWSAASGAAITYPSLTLSNLQSFSGFAVSTGFAGTTFSPEAGVVSNGSMISMFVQTTCGLSNTATLTLGTSGSYPGSGRVEILVESSTLDPVLSVNT